VAKKAKKAAPAEAVETAEEPKVEVGDVKPKILEELEAENEEAKAEITIADSDGVLKELVEDDAPEIEPVETAEREVAIGTPENYIKAVSGIIADLELRLTREAVMASSKLRQALYWLKKL